MKIASMKITSSKEVYSCSLFRVTEDEAEDRTGWKMKRSIVRHRGSAVMMAVDEKNRVLLVRQYRLPANQFLWELPAGKTDEGENALQAAKRELIEETGLRAKKWKKLVSFFPSPGYVEEKMTIFLATDLTAGRIAADGRRTHRDALVHEEGNARSDRVEQDSRCENDDRISLLGSTVDFVGGRCGGKTGADTQACPSENSLRLLRRFLHGLLCRGLARSFLCRRFLRPPSSRLSLLPSWL